MLILGIAVAGALGALARWGLGNGFVKWLGPRFPYDTLSANLIGEGLNDALNPRLRDGR